MQNSCVAVASDLDDIDEEILRILRVDGRRSLASIGESVGLSVSAVKRRVDRLCEDGVIVNFTAVVDRRKLGRALEAFVELRVGGNTSLEEIERIVSGMSDVRGLFITAGDPDAVVWLQVNNIEDLRKSIDSLRKGGKVLGTKVLMVLKSWYPSSH